MYKCIKGFSIEKCDDDGYFTEEYMTIEKGSIWELPENIDYRFVGGEVRLESDELGWIEISEETFNECFVEVRSG